MDGRAIGGSVVGEQLLEGDPVAGEERDGSSEEPITVWPSRLRALGARQAGAVVDRDVHAVPDVGAADALGIGPGRIAPSLAGNAVSGAALAPPEPLDVDVDQSPGLARS